VVNDRFELENEVHDFRFGCSTVHLQLTAAVSVCSATRPAEAYQLPISLQ